MVGFACYGLHNPIRTPSRPRPSIGIGSGMIPIDPKDVPIFAPDFVEFLAAFGTMVIAFAVMIVLGYWWQR